MVSPASLNTLDALQHEMARNGRVAEQAAIAEVLQALEAPGFLSTGEAGARLDDSIPTIKRWIQRGALQGGPAGPQWIVSAASVDRLLRLRQALAELDAQGNPTAEEIVALERPRPAADRRGRARSS